MPHLLLVDDDDLFRESLGLNLVDEGYEVRSFDNGQDALAYLNDGSADVMLLDWRMPNLTGIDVLRRMRGAGITIPVIFLTVLSDDFYEQAALEGGAVDFIDKARRLPILLKAAAADCGRRTVGARARTGAGAVAPARSTYAAL
jgi:two-component system response regulator ChvI